MRLSYKMLENPTTVTVDETARTYTRHGLGVLGVGSMTFPDARRILDDGETDEFPGIQARKNPPSYGERK